MNDTRPTGDASGFPGRTAAVSLGATLSVALFLVLVVTWRDNGRRVQLETTVELTAVGDTHYFPLPNVAPALSYPAVASLHGQLLYPVDFLRREHPADDMARVGVDEKAGYIVYQLPVKEKNADEVKLGPVYYLKISATEYLKTRPALTEGK